jgi:hypothetical protein
MCLPFAKPSAEPLTASAAVTLETSAAMAEMKREDLIFSSRNEWAAKSICSNECDVVNERLNERLKLEDCPPTARRTSYNNLMILQ